MTVSVFFNVFLVAVIAGFSFLAARSLFDALSGTQGAIRGAAYFWLWSGVVWALGGVRLISAYAGVFWLDRVLFLAGQFFVGLSVVSGALYLGWRLFLRERMAKITGGIYGAGVVLFLALLYAGGVSGPAINTWGTKYTLNVRAELAFAILLAGLFVVVGYDFFVSIGRFILKKSVHRPAFFLALAFIVYAASGFGEQLTAEFGWQLMLVRMFFLVAAFLSYAASFGIQKEAFHPLA